VHGLGAGSNSIGAARQEGRHGGRPARPHHDCAGQAIGRGVREICRRRHTEVESRRTARDAGTARPGSSAWPRGDFGNEVEMDQVGRVETLLAARLLEAEARKPAR